MYHGFIHLHSNAQRVAAENAPRRTGIRMAYPHALNALSGRFGTQRKKMTFINAGTPGNCLLTSYGVLTTFGDNRKICIEGKLGGAHFAFGYRDARLAHWKTRARIHVTFGSGQRSHGSLV